MRSPTWLAQYDPQALLKLEPGALPTISASACDTTAQSEATSPKQRRLEASIDVSAEYSGPAHSASVEDVEHDDTFYQLPTASGSPRSGPGVSLGAAACTPVRAASAGQNFDAQTQCRVDVRERATQAALKPHMRTIRVQTICATREVACQTEWGLPELVLMKELREQCSSPVPSEEASFAFQDDPCDSSFEPPASESSAVAIPDSHPSTRKFVVYEDCLLQLFRSCKQCGFRTEPILKTIGSLAIIKTTCHCGQKEWRSQPMQAKYAAGNVELAAAMVFTGCCPTQTVRFLENAGICCFTTRTFHRIQSRLLLPAVDKVWQEQQMSLLEDVKAAGAGAKLAGDSRADSPGHCAKFGTYSLLDTKLNKIVCVKLVESKEVASSNHMELEGLKRALKELTDSGVRVAEVITDRHPQVRKYFRTQQPDVDHRFDAWHVAKGLKKKLAAASKIRGCELIALWSHSIVTHLYHAVVVGAGNGELAVAVWLSMLNHVQDIHDGHSQLYRTCQHGQLEPRKWIYPGTDGYDKLHAIVGTKRLLDDIRQVSPNFQTYGVESFHSIINRFAPKALSFSRAGMQARCTLAALHYNENSGRDQAVTKDGELRWQMRQPKAKTGKPTVAAIKVAATYGYVARLQDAVDVVLSTGSLPSDNVLAGGSALPSDSSTNTSALLGEPAEEEPALPTAAEVKRALVAGHRSRYRT